MTQTPIKQVKVGKRMRQLDEDKVLELMSSYRESGQINPISLDKELTLLAGHHRLERGKLGWKTIDAKILMPMIYIKD